MQPKPRQNKNTALLRALLLASMAALVIWVALAAQRPRKTVDVPAQSRDAAQVPAPVSTEPPPTFPPSPTEVAPPPTPTVKIWPTPVQIRDITVSAMSTTSEVGVGQKTTVNSAVPISHFIWAPTGDKLVYLTGNKLYWCNPDGSNPTLIVQYDEGDDELEEQMPMGNTLLIRHIGRLLPGGGPPPGRAPSHLDVIRFTPGQPPTLQEGPDLPHAPMQLRWWSPTRASGVWQAGSEGGELLVTVDQDGRLVDEVNIPYMVEGQVRPGGGWLAYSTNYQVTNPIDGSSPNTGYLLNLNTGQRLQVTQAGGGGGGNWSPDGNWFLISSNLGIALVSADGHQWVTIPDPAASIDAVWSPNSRYLAYAEVNDQSPDGHVITSWTGKVHIVNVPQRKVTDVSDGKSAAPSTDSEIMWQPKWSRDSSLISFLSFDPRCPFECSKLSPAIIHMAPTP